MNSLESERDRLMERIEHERLEMQRAERKRLMHFQAMAQLTSKLKGLEEKIKREKFREE